MIRIFDFRGTVKPFIITAAPRGAPHFSAGATQVSTPLRLHLPATRRQSVAVRNLLLLAIGSLLAAVACTGGGGTADVVAAAAPGDKPAPAPMPTAVPTQITTPSPSVKSDGFPTVEITAFMIECQQTGISQANCSCTIGRLQINYSYDEFVQLGLDLGDTEHIPEHLARVLAHCDP